VLGKPVGKDSGTNTWEGDQWKIGGGTTWGWYSYDPESQPVLLRHRQPVDLEPGAAPGRQPLVDDHHGPRPRHRHGQVGLPDDPHDEWDYDGINEMILADRKVIGVQMRKVLVHFDRNGFAYTMDRVSGELLVAEKYDPVVNWATGTST
jgi:glucose dehydrogenase